MQFEKTASHKKITKSVNYNQNFSDSGVDGMVIMRIHYAWKEFFAVEQSGDFLWQQRWDSSGKGTILCHNFPYDIYSIKGSCGPHAQVTQCSRKWSLLQFKAT